MSEKKVTMAEIRRTIGTSIGTALGIVIGMIWTKVVLGARANTLRLKRLGLRS